MAFKLHSTALATLRDVAGDELLNRLDPVEAMDDLKLIEAILKSADSDWKVISVQDL